MPNACPSWRAALTMPDAIPALRRSTALMAIVEIGVPHSPIAAPSSAKFHQLGAALAEGLAAIHACALIHRDLKPSNIILADDGPRIIDFGIAKGTDFPSLTGSSDIIGTLRYMDAFRNNLSSRRVATAGQPAPNVHYSRRHEHSDDHGQPFPTGLTDSEFSCADNRNVNQLGPSTVNDH